MAAGSQHVDVCARAKYPALGAGDDNCPHLGMLKANPLQRIVQLDIDTEIIGIQLQLVPRTNPAVFLCVHHEGCHFAIKLQLPVLVPRRIGLVVHHLGSRLSGQSRLHKHLLTPRLLYALYRSSLDWIVDTGLATEELVALQTHYIAYAGWGPAGFANSQIPEPPIVSATF